jgi:putative DNA primase/helicase
MTPTAASITRALGGNTDSGMCRCPAHDDRRPSLHVSEGNSGKPVFYCHAGCTQDDVIAALKHKGVWQVPGHHNFQQKRYTNGNDAEDDPSARLLEAFSILYAAAKADTGQPTEYLRGRGIKLEPPCASILPAKDSGRLLGKYFPAMVCTVNDDSGFLGAHVTLLARDAKEKCAADTPRLLYGTTKGGYVQLSKRSEIDPNKPLIIGEGIETTLSAMQLANLPGIASLSASNMSAVKIPSCKSAIVAADHDEPGRKAAALLAERLQFQGLQVRIALPPTEGTDWNDVLLHSGDAAADWQAALEAGDPKAYTGPVTALEEAEFMALAFPRLDSLLGPWLSRASLCMIHAQRGEGKTWLALAVGKALANGDSLLGWPCPKYVRVLYVDGELPGSFLQERLGKFRQSPPGCFHVLCRDAFLLKKQAMPNLGDPQGCVELDRIIDEINPNVVILDSLSTLVRSGVENEAESWAPIQDWLLKHRWQGRTIILVHHEGKGGKPRGSSKREDVLDTMIGLRKKGDQCTEEESVFEFDFHQGSRFLSDDAAPMLIKLKVTNGQVTWDHEKVRDARLEQIREMRADGMKPKDIAKELGLTPGRVSQIMKELRKNDNVVQFHKRGDGQDDREGNEKEA